MFGKARHYIRLAFKEAARYIRNNLELSKTSPLITWKEVRPFGNKEIAWRDAGKAWIREERDGTFSVRYSRRYLNTDVWDYKRFGNTKYGVGIGVRTLRYEDSKGHTYESAMKRRDQIVAQFMQRRRDSRREYGFIAAYVV